MAVNNTLATTNGKAKIKFSAAIQSEGYQKLINTTLRDPKRANRFVAAIMSAVSSNPALQECDAATVLSAALQGEALELSPSQTLGEYYLVPYKKKRKNPETEEWEEVSICQFQIGTAGRVQLAMRSGQYKTLYAMEIREGEYRGRNRENGKPLFVFEEDDSIRENLPIIGYLAFYELINGFQHSVYFSKEKCLNWAERYSKSFDRKLYDKVQSGKAITDWKEKNAAEAPWIKHTDEMCKNLVIRQVLKNAPKSIEMRNLLDGDDKSENDVAMVATPKEEQVSAEVVTEEFFSNAPTEEPKEAKKTATKKATQE